MTMTQDRVMPEVDRASASVAAVRARRERAELKRALREGRLQHQQVLVTAKSTDGVEAGLRVSEFLGTLPRVGVVTRTQIMADLEIAERKRLGGLGQRQAAKLWDFLGQWLSKHPVYVAPEVTAPDEDHSA